MSNYNKKRKSYGGGSSSKTNTPSIPLGQKDSYNNKDSIIMQLVVGLLNSRWLQS